MSAIGMLSSTSRITPPPTAATVPMKSAGTTGSPIESAFVAPIAPKRPSASASATLMSGSTL